MEILKQIAETLGTDVTIKELFVDNIDNFKLFIPLPGKSYEKSAEDIYFKIRSQRWEQMCKSITLNYICDTVDLRHDEHRLKRFETVFRCKRRKTSINLVIEIPWDRIEKQVVEKTSLGKRRYLLVKEHYPQLYFKEGAVAGIEPCPICYEKFESWDGVCRPNGCLHHFHTDCLKLWFKGKSKPNCPYCRVYCTGINYVLRKKDYE